MTYTDDINVIGLPATVLTWLSMLNLISLNPFADMVIKVMSVVWLSMQIYGWVEKRYKERKHGSKQKSGETS